MLGQYYYHKTFLKTINAFGTLFNDIYIRHKDANDNTVSELRVPIAYGPTQKFLAKIEQQENLSKPVQITLPRMSYEIVDISYDTSRKVSATQSFKASDGEKLKKVYFPVPYNISFELNIMSKLTDDAFQIIEQILPYFQPAFNVTINFLDSIEEKRDIPFILESIDFQDDYEGDFSTRRSLIYTLRFTAKTYLFGPIADSTDGLIRKVQVDYYTDTNVQDAKREVRYTVEPNPRTANPGDDFIFDESVEFLNDSKEYSPTQRKDL